MGTWRNYEGVCRKIDLIITLKYMQPKHHKFNKPVIAVWYKIFEELAYLIEYLITRMHSSRMRTAHSLPYGGVSVWGVSVWGVSVRGSLSGGLCPGGLCLGVSVQGGFCLGVSVQGGLCLGGFCPEGFCLGVSRGVSGGGVSVQGVSVQGVSVWGGGLCLRIFSLTVTPSPREQNHRHLWKHNLAATSLWAVKMN